MHQTGKRLVKMCSKDISWLEYHLLNILQLQYVEMAAQGTCDCFL